jgi:hypothetical protein
MSTNLDIVGGPVQQKTVSEDEIYELEHGDLIIEEEAVAFTNEALYAVPGNASEEDVRTEVGADEAYVRTVSYDEDARTSASAPRVNEEQLNELAAIVESPFAVLDGKVQERNQSTDAVYDQPQDYAEIDVIE